MRDFTTLFKTLLIAALFVIGNISLSAETIEFDFSAQGYENAETVTGGTIDANITFTATEGSNEPKYYNTGTGLRVYNGGTFLVNPLNGATITEITLTFSAPGYTFNNDDQNPTIWAGNSSTSVSFSVTRTSRLQKVSVTYNLGSPSTVAPPTFSPEGGTFTTPQSVTLSAEAGASIYYTTDGSTPDESSNLYGEAITVNTTMTIKAIAILNGESSTVASQTYTFPIQVADIAGFLATAETGEVIITGPVTVVYQNGINLYIQDASGSLLVYGNIDKTFVNGDQLTGLKGILGVYGQSPQMTSPVAPDATSGTAISPITFDLSTVTTDDHAKYVKVENVQFNDDVEFSSSSIVNAQLVSPNGFTVRDNFRLGGSFTAGVDYNITGFISYYNGTPQLFPVEITEVPSSDPKISVSVSSIPAMSASVGSSATETIDVGGSNLTENISLVITDDANGFFSISTATIAQTGGTAESTTVTITYTPTAAGSHTATLTLASAGAESKVITLTGAATYASLATPTTNTTDISQAGFTANWDAVDGATSYDLHVYTKEESFASDLIISEYVEGTSNNKFIEIYNGTGSEVELSNYQLILYSNGASNATYTNTLSGTLSHGSTVVYKHTSASLNLPSGVTAIESTSCNYNGDDAIALYNNSTASYVDIFGKIGEDPGTAWTTNEYSTLDKTLRRKATVLSGVTTNPTSGFPTLATEWDLYAIDDVSGLGSHSMNTASPISGSPFTGLTSLSHTISDLSNANTYYYYVIAKNSNVESLPSEEESVSLVPSNLNNPTTSLSLYASNGCIMVNATAGESIEIYTVAGQKIGSRIAEEGLNSIAVNTHGLIIVKAGSRVGKIIL